MGISDSKQQPKPEFEDKILKEELASHKKSEDDKGPSSEPVPRYLNKNIDSIKNIAKDIIKDHDIFSTEDSVFFQKTHLLNELAQNENIREQVEIFFSLKPLTKNINQLYYLQVSMSKKVEGLFETLGSTNSKFGKKVDFDTSFVIEYFFEFKQFLKIKLYDAKNKTLVSELETTVANIVGAKGQNITLNDEKVGACIIKSNPYNKSEDLCVVFTTKLNFPNKDINPFFIVKRNVSEESKFIWISSFKSEVNTNYAANHLFKKSSLKIQMISSECSLTKPFLIEFYDFHTKKSIGSLLTTVAEMSDENFIGKLQNENGELIPNTEITFSCEVVEEFKFVDYLRGGLQLSMIFGIDYTASNGEIHDPSSLHYIKSDSYNNYQQAIRYCGDIVAFYDYDQLFPVFGYGAILNGQTDTSFCFNCNFQDDPNVNTIDGVLDVYKKSLSMVKLYGPTFFSPIIKKAIKLATGIVENKDYIYSIMVILTDGKINDLQQTKDMLVRASFLPISVIIIGIGDADFGDMSILDSDDVVLMDSKGQRAVRDIVQFVPMNIFKSDGVLLAEKVLEEIPRQIIDYFKLINEPPREANMFLI